MKIARIFAHRVELPLIEGSYKWSGGKSVSVFDSTRPDAPCYACVFPPDQTPEEVRCATLGVLAPLVGVVGTMQAMETVKLITGMGSHLVGKLQMLDGRHMDWSTLRLQRNPQCPVCGGAH